MTDMPYYSTRSDRSEPGVSSSYAVLRGTAPDGGLYVPAEIPALEPDWGFLATLSYKRLAYEILKLYFTDYSEEELRAGIDFAYDGKFNHPDITPVVKESGAFFLELFHGKTLAFKDVALSLLPHLMKAAAEKHGVTDEITILTATSGDTGKAALEGFRDMENMSIIVFYPEKGVSSAQKMQMLTQEGKNTYVVGVRGNFDDAQRGVKEIFNRKTENRFLSSANSINIGRLAPQIVYYFHAYLKLCGEGEVAPGEKINFTVPTGNFGNILAGYYAKEMGLPVNRLVCASNQNNVLSDFFNTGKYDRNRSLVKTCSPSMDILVSSNLERLVYALTGGRRTAGLMRELDESGRYELDLQSRAFAGEFLTEEETRDSIREVFENGYLIDTHTAVAYGAYKKYRDKNGDKHKNVVVATASPYKFAEAVVPAINRQYDHQVLGAAGAVRALARISGIPIPYQISQLNFMPILHNTVCDAADMGKVVDSIINRER